MLSGEQVRETSAELINLFFESASPDNNFFGSDHLLNRIKEQYETLNDSDKEIIQTHIRKKHNEAFPPEAKDAHLSEFKKDFAIGAALGVATGFAGIALYNTVTKASFAVKQCIFPAISTFVGAFYYPGLKNVSKMNEFNQRERPFGRLKSTLNIGTALTSPLTKLANYGSERSAAGEAVLRQRRT